MLAVPFALGVVAGGPDWVHLPLALVWVVGYLEHHALSVWLRSRFKRRYLPPVRAWAVALAGPGVLVAVLRPDLLPWAGAVVPLLVLSLWCAYRRADRSLGAGLVTVLAACLALPVAAQAGAGAGAGPGSTTPEVAAWTVVVALYLAGTVFYVKTVIRERGRRGYLVLSVVFHAVATGAVAVTLAAADLSWRGAAVLFALLTVRAAAVPRLHPSPLQVGLAELLASGLVVAVLVVGA